jgi:hypothetical protein
VENTERQDFRFGASSGSDMVVVMPERAVGSLVQLCKLLLYNHYLFSKQALFASTPEHSHLRKKSKTTGMAFETSTVHRRAGCT